MDLKLHPELEESLIKLCDDPQTTVVVLSGSDRTVLDEVFIKIYFSFEFSVNNFYFILFFFVLDNGELFFYSPEL